MSPPPSLIYRLSHIIISTKKREKKEIRDYHIMVLLRKNSDYIRRKREILEKIRDINI